MSQIDERTPTDLIEIDAEDDNALRAVVVVPWELPGRVGAVATPLRPGPGTDHGRSGPDRFRWGISPAARAGEETDALR